MSDKQVRNSSIELFKIFGMLAIMISHITLTLIEGGYDWSIDIASGFNVINFTLFCFHHLGVIGNLMFLIPSVWFLTESKTIKTNKVLKLIFDVIIISIIFLIVFLSLGFPITLKETIKSLFPITFRNNWYITCYLLLYLIHPILNLVLEKTKKTYLFSIIIVCVLIYFIADTVLGYEFYLNDFVFFVVTYLIVGFFKNNKIDLLNNNKVNKIVFFISLLVFSTYLILYFYIASNVAFFGARIKYFITTHNPIIFLLLLSSFNLIRNKSFTNKLINEISSLSLIYYVVHENILFRTYARPLLFSYVYDHFGIDWIYPFAYILIVTLFVSSLIISFAYKYSIGKFTAFASKKCAVFINAAFKRMRLICGIIEE